MIFEQERIAPGGPLGGDSESPLYIEAIEEKDLNKAPDTPTQYPEELARAATKDGNAQTGLEPLNTTQDDEQLLQRIEQNEELINSFKTILGRARQFERGEISDQRTAYIIYLIFERLKLGHKINFYVHDRSVLNQLIEIVKNEPNLEIKIKEITKQDGSMALSLYNDNEEIITSTSPPDKIIKEIREYYPQNNQITPDDVEAIIIFDALLNSKLKGNFSLENAEELTQDIIEEALRAILRKRNLKLKNVSVTQRKDDSGIHGKHIEFQIEFPDRSFTTEVAIQNERDKTMGGGEERVIREIIIKGPQNVAKLIERIRETNVPSTDEEIKALKKAILKHKNLDEDQYEIEIRQDKWTGVIDRIEITHKEIAQKKRTKRRERLVARIARNRRTRLEVEATDIRERWGIDIDPTNTPTGTTILKALELDPQNYDVKIEESSTDTNKLTIMITNKSIPAIAESMSKMAQEATETIRKIPEILIDKEIRALREGETKFISNQEYIKALTENTKQGKSDSDLKEETIAENLRKRGIDPDEVKISIRKDDQGNILAIEITKNLNKEKREQREAKAEKRERKKRKAFLDGIERELESSPNATISIDDIPIPLDEKNATTESIERAMHVVLGTNSEKYNIEVAEFPMGLPTDFNPKYKVIITKKNELPELIQGDDTTHETTRRHEPLEQLIERILTSNEEENTSAIPLTEEELKGLLPEGATNIITVLKDRLKEHNIFITLERDQEGGYIINIARQPPPVGQLIQHIKL